MAFSTGINKQVAYKAESTWGTLAGAASAKLLRRVTASFNLAKETYQSNEIRTDYQVADFRHGVRSAEGSLNGELSPGSYSDFMAAVVARDFTAGVASALGAATYTIVAATAPFFTLSRSAGSFLTDGLKAGDVVRITGGGTNLLKNILIVEVTNATTLKIMSANPAVTISAEATVASATLTVVGKKTYAPTSGHTDKSFTIEEWYTDVTQSEVYTGMKVDTMSIAMPATGLVTVDFGFKGKDLAQTGTSQYFTTPTAQGTSGVFASVNGVLTINGAAVALLTGLNIKISRNMQNATVVGSNAIQELFEGRIVVDGDFSAYFDGGTIRDLFNAETEVGLVVCLTTANTGTADFISINLPRIKVNSNTRDDGENGVTAQHSFTALFNGNGGTGVGTEKTTITIQDSLA